MAYQRRNPHLTDEDRAALHDLYLRERRQRATVQVRDPRRLMPWMRAFASWMADQPKQPSVTEQRLAASKCARATVGRQELAVLKHREDFQELLKTLEESAVARAREKMEADLPWYIEQHRVGLEMALKEGDYKKIPDYTSPAWERAWPRRDGVNVAAAHVSVTLSVSQAAALEKTPVEVEAVEVEPTDG